MRLLLFCLLSLVLISVKGQKKDAAYWYDEGLKAAESKDYKTALEYFTKTMELNPTESAAFYQRGMANYELHNYKLAIVDYNRAIRRNLRNGEIYYKRANAFFYLERYNAALESYQIALKFDSSNIEYKNSLKSVIEVEKEKRTKEKNSVENHYGPFHEKIKDSTINGPVSSIGIYFSGSVGGGSDYGIGSLAGLISLSCAYKSHLVTVTRAASDDPLYGGTSDSGPYQQTNYIGILFGESIRYKHAMLSLSAGTAISNVYTFHFFYPAQYNYIKQEIISFPIELKGFILIRNGIGIGLSLTENLIPQANYSTTYIGISFVTGIWNTFNKK